MLRWGKETGSRAHNPSFGRVGRQKKISNSILSRVGKKMKNIIVAVLVSLGMVSVAHGAGNAEAGKEKVAVNMHIMISIQ